MLFRETARIALRKDLPMAYSNEAPACPLPEEPLADALPIDVTRSYTDEEVGLSDDIEVLSHMVASVVPGDVCMCPSGIDLAAASDEFLRYTGTFDVTNQHIRRKVGHSVRVALLAVRLAEEAGVSGDGYGTYINPSVAFLAGLLHDVGRFPQFAMHRSYDDSSTGCDHGDLGAALLADYGLLERFLPIGANGTDLGKPRRIVIEATRWHNKKGLPDGMSPDELGYTTLVRDADIIDIMRLWVTGRMAGTPFASVRDVTWDDISDEVRKAVAERRTADRSRMRTDGDKAVGKALLPWELSQVARRLPDVRRWIGFQS